MKHIKAKFEELKKLIAKGNEIEEAIESSDEITEEMIKAFDEAYAAEYNVRRELAKAVEKLADEIDYDTALKMTYNPKFAELIECI